MKYMDDYAKILTPRERMKCAYLHLIRGMLVQDLAIAFEVSADQISEAIMAVKKAA